MFSQAQAKKVCKGGHLHYGTSDGPVASKKLAIRQAIRTWSSFTVAEYGPAWGSYKLAVDKRADCKREEETKWYCEIAASPCARARRVRSVRRLKARPSRARRASRARNKRVSRR